MTALCKKLWEIRTSERSGQICQQPAKNIGESENPKSESSATMGRPPPSDGNGNRPTNQSRNQQQTLGNPQIPTDPSNHGSNLQKTSGNPKIRKDSGNQGSNLQKTPGNPKIRKIRATLPATCKKHRGIRKSENPKAQQPWGGLHLLMQMAIHRPTNPGICKNFGKPNIQKDPRNHVSNLQKTSGNPKIRKIRVTMPATCKKPR